MKTIAEHVVKWGGGPREAAFRKSSIRKAEKEG